MTVNSSTTTLIFTAPSLHHNVFTGTVVVMVTAISRYGVGPASNPVTVIITGMWLLHNVNYCTVPLISNLSLTHKYIVK